MYGAKLACENSSETIQWLGLHGFIPGQGTKIPTSFIAQPQKILPEYYSLINFS